MIEVDTLSFSYPGGQTHAVDEIRFSVAPGEIFGFLGPSGAGKSTTQKILIGLLRGYTGSAAVLGREVAAWGRDFYEEIGVGFELPNHFLKLTGLENLAHFASLYRRPTRDPRELLALVGLEADGRRRVGQYSKGMRMRLNFVRALLHDPPLYFFDEPTAGLDPVNGRKIKDLILGLRAAGRTIFLTTHDMAVADELCDRVAFIVDGCITTIDSPQNLKLAHGRRTVVVRYGENGRRAEREFPLDGLGHDAAFLELIQREHLQTIHTQEATLEEIFIQVTGRSLR